MRVLEVLWAWAGDVLPGRWFGAIVRWLFLAAAVVGLVVPEVRSSVFAWVAAQEAARVEPAIRAAMDAVVEAALRREK